MVGFGLESSPGTPVPPGPPPQKPLYTWRCVRCGEVLARVWLPPGTIIRGVRCVRCGEEQDRVAA